LVDIENNRPSRKFYVSSRLFVQLFLVDIYYVYIFHEL